MARNEEEAPRGHRILQVAAVAFLCGATALAFGRVFVGTEPTVKLAAVALVSVALAVVFERRNLLLAGLASLAGLLLTVTYFVYPHTAWYGLPSGETLEAGGRWR